MKIAVREIPPVTLIALRVLIAAALLLAALRLRGERLPAEAASWAALAPQAVLNSVGPWLAAAWSQQVVDSALIGVLNSTSPIFVLLMTALYFRHELPP